MKKILVVEDSEIVKENLIDLLEVNDYEVISAYNGKVGYEKAVSELPDLIISDIMMPEMNGYELAKQLQLNSLTDSIPLIFLSAKVELADIREGMKLGAEDYITKPFTSKEILEAIELRLSKKDKFNKKIDDFKDELLTKFNHELRNPLTPVIGLSELLNEEFDNLSRDEAIEFINVIKKSGNNLSQKIEKIIILSELERTLNDKELLEKQKNMTCGNTAEIINNSARKTSRCYNNREQDLALYIIYGASLIIEEDHLMMVVNELVDNAFKFSKSGSKVVIETEQNGNDFSILVKDNGIGLSQTQLNSSSLFGQYNREISLSGLGTGIALVKKILDIYSGKIELINDINFSTAIKVTLKIKE